MIHSEQCTESFHAPTQAVFAGGALGAAKQGRRSLEVFSGTVEFERFRPRLNSGLGYSDGAKGGRPAFDPVGMLKVLVVQVQHYLSDARMQFMIRDRLSWMRFFGFDLVALCPTRIQFATIATG